MTRQKEYSRRQLQFSEDVRRHLTLIIKSETDLDNISNLITISKVISSSDLRICKIYFRCNIKSKKEFGIILNQKSKSLAFSLSKEINLRIIPKLIFYFDDTIEYISFIEKLFIDNQNQ